MLAISPSTLPEIDQIPGRPAILQATHTGDAASWTGEHASALRSLVAEHGAVLVRGLGLCDESEVGAVFRGLSVELMRDTEAFAAREKYSDGLYSSSAWPLGQPMCMHHELSYVREAPSLMMFACLNAPSSGGATGVADAQAVLEALPPELVAPFEKHGWMLTRNYNDEIGASFADAFGTDSRAEIESYCRSAGIDWEWLPDGGLRTMQRRPAVVRHPLSGQRCWFNQIAFLNEWTLDSEVREYLVEVYGADGMPFNTRYGNGEAIGGDVVAAINEAYEANTMREPWQTGDLMLVDNVRMAHSREAYEGEREIVVAMSDPVRLAG